MRFGKLRRRIELKSNTGKHQNDYGESIDGFVKYADVWAEIRPLSGRELERAKQINEEISYMVRIRYREEVTAKDIVAFGSRTLEINAVINPEERNEELLLYCKELK